MVAPSDQKEATELTTIAARMDGAYGRGKWCPDPKNGSRPSLPRHRGRSPRSWRTAATRSGCAKSGRAGTPSRSRCGRTTSASSSCPTRAPNELGFPDTGAMWRSKYDMPPDEFAEGDGSPVGAGPAALPLAACLHAHEAAREVRRRGAGEGTDSGAPARQHLGAELGEPLSRRRAEDRRAGLRPHEDPRGAQDVGGRHGEVRRAILRLARPGAAAADLLRAIAAGEAARSRGGLPRQRVGRSISPRMCASRCASTRPPKTSR